MGCELDALIMHNIIKEQDRILEAIKKKLIIEYLKMDKGIGKGSFLKEKKCTCGAEKCKTPHSDWCDTQENGLDLV